MSNVERALAESVRLLIEVQNAYDELAHAATTEDDLQQLFALQQRIDQVSALVANNTAAAEQERARIKAEEEERRRKEEEEAQQARAEAARRRAIATATASVQRTQVERENQLGHYPTVIAEPAEPGRRARPAATGAIKPVSEDARDMWTGIARSADQELEESLIYAAYLVRDLPGVQKIERAGDWLWLHGETHSIKEQLKAAGFRFSPEKTRTSGLGVWYWSPTERRPRNYRGNVPLGHIYAKYGRTALKDDEK